MELLARLNDWVGQQLGAASGPDTLLFLFLGGLLASLLPCVYPLYPVTAAILRSRESRIGKWVHPVTYYLGLAAVYFGFGLLASVTGGAFNEFLRLPLANLGIGVLLFLLALATVGQLDFPVLSSRAGGNEALAGTFLMGAGAGLLSGACVGPVVVSILVGLATQAGSISIGMALSAATKMLLFGLGAGAPIVLIGVFGLALPRGGKWMVYIQWAFGLLIAGFAWGYVGKALSAYGFRDGVANALVLGALIVVTAAYFLQGEDKLPTTRTKRALLVLAGVIGIFVMGRHLLAVPGLSALPDAAVIGPARAATEQDGNLTWHLDKDAAYAVAARSGKPVFVDFHADWCTNCDAFQNLAHSDEALNEALRGAVLLKVYDTSPLFQEYHSDPRFPELKVGLPFFVITDSNGNVIYKTSDLTKIDEMVLILSG